MSFEMQYEINGQKVSEAAWRKHVFEEEPRRIVREHMEEIASRAKAIKCPEHGAGAVNAEVVESGGTYSVKTDCCCEASAALLEAVV